MIDLGSIAGLHEHQHELHAFCATCDRWRVLDLAGMVGRGLGSKRLPIVVRCRECGERGQLQVRPPTPTWTNANGWPMPSEVLREVERRVRQVMRAKKRDDSAPKLAKLDAEVANIVAAIAQGLLSPALRQRLQEAEAEIERLKRAPKPATVESLLPQLPAMIRKHVATIERFAEHDPLRARAAVRQALEADLIVLRPAEHGRHVVAHFGLDPVAIATGTEAENVVAGAGFGMYRHTPFASA